VNHLSAVHVRLSAKRQSVKDGQENMTSTHTHTHKHRHTRTQAHSLFVGLCVGYVVVFLLLINIL